MIAILGLMACGVGPFDAPPGATVTPLAETYTFTYNVDLAFEDGFGFTALTVAQVSPDSTCLFHQTGA